MNDAVKRVYTLTVFSNDIQRVEREDRFVYLCNKTNAKRLKTVQSKVHDVLVFDNPLDRKRFIDLNFGYLKIKVKNRGVMVMESSIGKINGK